MKDLRIKPLSLTWWGMLLGSLLITVYLCYNPGHLKSFGIMELIIFVLYKYFLSKDKTHNFIFWDELPLAFCNINGIYYCIGVLTGNQHLLAYCLLVEPLAAVMALLTPIEGFEDAPLFSAKGLGFYGYHFLLITQGLTVAFAGIYQPLYRHIPYVLLIGGVTIIAVHLINMLLRVTVDPIANYCFTYGLEGNFILEKLKSIWNVDGLYELLFLPIAGVLYLIVYLLIGAK